MKKLLLGNKVCGNHKSLHPVILSAAINKVTHTTKVASQINGIKFRGQVLKRKRKFDEDGLSRANEEGKRVCSLLTLVQV